MMRLKTEIGNKVFYHESIEELKNEILKEYQTLVDKIASFDNKEEKLHKEFETKLKKLKESQAKKVKPLKKQHAILKEVLISLGENMSNNAVDSQEKAEQEKLNTNQ